MSLYGKQAEQEKRVISKRRSEYRRAEKKNAVRAANSYYWHGVRFQQYAIVVNRISVRRVTRLGTRLEADVW